MGPLLGVTRRRDQFFVDTVEALVEHLRDIAPAELDGIHVMVSAMPDQPSHLPGIARWRVDKARKTVHLFRLPIERLGGQHIHDPWQRRMAIESTVIRAIAELIDWDPWRLAHGGHGFH